MENLRKLRINLGHVLAQLCHPCYKFLIQLRRLRLCPVYHRRELGLVDGRTLDNLYLLLPFLSFIKGHMNLTCKNHFPRPRAINRIGAVDIVDILIRLRVLRILHHKTVCQRCRCINGKIIYHNALDLIAFGRLDDCENTVTIVHIRRVDTVLSQRPCWRYSCKKSLRCVRIVLTCVRLKTCRKLIFHHRVFQFDFQRLLLLKGRV